MEIRFSRGEVERIRDYLKKVSTGETQLQWQGYQQAFPEWPTVFLLFRKLLAYGIYYDSQADHRKTYEDLQTKSQKPDRMLETVHTHPDQFEQLLAIYTNSHPL